MAVPLNQDSIKLAAILQLIRNVPLLIQKQPSKVQQALTVVPIKPAQPPKPKDVAVKKRKSSSSGDASTSALKSPKLPRIPVKAPYKVSKKVAPSKKAKRKESIVSLPLSRVRTVMKTAPEASSLSQESITVAAKAAELFVARLAQGAYRDALEKGAGEVCYRHLATSVRKHPKHFNFLFDFLPHKVLGRDVLASTQAVSSVTNDNSSKQEDQSSLL